MSQNYLRPRCHKTPDLNVFKLDLYDVQSTLTSYTMISNPNNHGDNEVTQGTGTPSCSREVDGLPPVNEKRKNDEGECEFRKLFNESYDFSRLCKTYPLFCEECLERVTLISSLQFNYKHFEDTALQSDSEAVPESNSSGGDSGTQQTLTYVDDNAGSTVAFNSIADNSFYNDFTAGVELGDFLSRPVLISTLTWTEATAFNTQLSPWYLFFNDTRIRKKIDNYSLLSANLHIKVMINASPFYYGSALMSYQPLPTFTPTTIKSIGTYDHDLVPYSQRPHIWIYPQASQGGEMVLPFFYEKNWLRVNVGADFTSMGTLDIREVVPLQSANSVVGIGATIQVYAWAEDVRVAGPTVALALQSKSEYMNNGPVSGPASAIAQATGMLSGLPVIGKYMTATSAFAGTLSTVAAWFGFTKVPVISDVMPVKNLPFHGMASTEIGEPTSKLTYDPKNELTVDPRVVGLDGKDEMLILPFLQKESFLKYYTWGSTDAVDTLIFASRVVPHLVRASSPYVQTTPLAYGTSLFYNWRGDIIFRFRFICSQYHRGRARITWDPEGNIISDTVSSSVAFTRIVDIAAEPDIEIRVPYMQARPWLYTLTSNFATEYFGGAAYAYARSPTYDNGTLTVRVFTKQTSPVASAPIQLMVSVRAADNFEVANPCEPPRQWSNYDLQSLSRLDEPVQEIAGNNTEKDHPEKFLVNWGESLKSFRQVLRRSCLSRVSFVSTDTTAQFSFIECSFARFPLYYGYDLSGIHLGKDYFTGLVNKPFNYVQNTPFNWMNPCYVGRRGSSVWQINVSCPESIGFIRASRLPESITSPAGYLVENVMATGVNKSQVAKIWYDGLYCGASGAELINQRTQTGLSVLSPMCTAAKMNTTAPSTATVGTGQDLSLVDNLRLNLTLNPLSQTGLNANTCVQFYHHVGPDFCLLFFLNTPTMVYTPSPVAG